MPAAIPPLLADLGAGAGALAAIIGLGVLVFGLLGRAWRKAVTAQHEMIAETIQAEVPAAVAAEVPRALEPHAAELRGQLVEVRRALMPNGGSSLRDQVDQVNRRVGSLEAGQRKLFAQLNTGGSLADAAAPDDPAPES